MPLRARILRIASTLPKGDETRRELLAVLQRDASQIGPYIRFNKRLWVKTYGKMTPREGGWDRVRLANPKTGVPNKTEVEIKWGKPGELSVYQSHRTQPTYRYEDVGMFVPTVKPSEAKAIIRDNANMKSVAAQIVGVAKAEGLNPGEALNFAGDILTDVNFHSLTKYVGGDSKITGMDVSDISSSIHWDAYAAAAIAWFVAAMVRSNGVKKEIEGVLLNNIQEDRVRELHKNLSRM